MDEWRCVSMIIGILSVMTGGTAEMLKSCVGNLTLMDVSNTHVTIVFHHHFVIFMPPLHAILFNVFLLKLLIYPLLSFGNRGESPLIHLYDVHCLGTEEKLTKSSSGGRR